MKLLLVFCLLRSISTIYGATIPSVSPSSDLQTTETYSFLTTSYFINQSTELFVGISSRPSSGTYKPPIVSPFGHQTSSISDTDTKHSKETASHKNYGNGSVMPLSDDALVLINKSKNTTVIAENASSMTQLPKMNINEGEESRNKSNDYSIYVTNETGIISSVSTQSSRSISHSYTGKDTTTMNISALSRETIDPENMATSTGRMTSTGTNRLYLSYLLDSFILKMCNVSKHNKSNIFRLTLQLEWMFLKETGKIRRNSPLDQESVEKFIEGVKKLQLCKIYRIDDNNSVSNIIRNVRTQKLGVLRKVTIGLMAAGILCILLALYYFGYKLHRKLNPKPVKGNRTTKTRGSEKSSRKKVKHEEYITKHNAAFENCWM